MSTKRIRTDVSEILSRIDQGTCHSSEELLPLVYDELRKLAAAKLSEEEVGQTLQPTALVHEAWLRLCGSHQQWNGRGHFFCAAAEAMRRILIDRARKKNRKRHGAGIQRVDLSAVQLATTTSDETLLQLDKAIGELAEEAPQAAELVKLRFFAGLTFGDAATALGISVSTAKRRWAYARSWLLCELEGD